MNAVARPHPLVRTAAAGLLALAATACGLDSTAHQSTYGEGLARPAVTYEGAGGAERSVALGRTDTARAPNLTPPAVDPIGLTMEWPVGGEGQITSDFGWRIDPIARTRRFHHGLDIGCWRGQRIGAAATGRVMYAGPARIYGNAVVVAHTASVWTIYGHLDRVSAKLGEHVKTGEWIGRCGSTGRSTGPHLHLEVRWGDTVVDPLRLLD